MARSTQSNTLLQDQAGTGTAVETPSPNLHSLAGLQELPPAPHHPTLPEGCVALSEIVSALSFALDLTEDAVPGHALRSCLLGIHIGAALGLHSGELADLYYALLLKDIGCSSNSAHMYQILGSDERRAKHAIKTVDWTDSLVAAARWSWTYALPGASPLRKVARLAWMSRHGESNNVALFLARCERGARIARKIGMSNRCADAIYALDEHWNGAGFPLHLRGADIPVLSRIVAVAQHLDVFASRLGRSHAIETLQKRSGSWFDPELVRIAVALHRDGTLWNGCETGSERRHVMDLEPGSARTADPAQIDRICQAFADVVDAKSPFTFHHSVGVMEAANGISGILGLAPERRQLIYRAALLHDVGKLSVPNTILDKPDILTDSEWIVVRRHPRLSQQILARIPSFAQIASIAGRHHERLDGSGYPNQLIGHDLCLEDRIVALADVFATLSEERPYRAAMQPEEIRTTLTFHVGRRLDPDCFDAAMQYMDQQQPFASSPELTLPSSPELRLPTPSIA